MFMLEPSAIVGPPVFYYDDLISATDSTDPSFPAANGICEIQSVVCSR